MTDMLRALLQKLDLQPGETLISLGDLVDKGPDPAGTVRYLRELKAQAEVEFVLIKANHDCLLYTSPSPRDQRGSRMPSSA